MNMFPLINETGKYNPSWLYSNLAEFYQTWLPGKDQQRTLREGGFYTVRQTLNLHLEKILCMRLRLFSDPSEAGLALGFR